MTTSPATGRRNVTERIKLRLMHRYRRLKRFGLEEKDANGQGRHGSVTG